MIAEDLAGRFDAERDPERQRLPVEPFRQSYHLDLANRVDEIGRYLERLTESRPWTRPTTGLSDVVEALQEETETEIRRRMRVLPGAPAPADTGLLPESPLRRGTVSHIFFENPNDGRLHPWSLDYGFAHYVLVPCTGTPSKLSDYALLRLPGGKRIDRSGTYPCMPIGGTAGVRYVSNGSVQWRGYTMPATVVDWVPSSYKETAALKWGEDWVDVRVIGVVAGGVSPGGDLPVYAPEWQDPIGAPFNRSMPWLVWMSEEEPDVAFGYKTGWEIAEEAAGQFLAAAGEYAYGWKAPLTIPVGQGIAASMTSPVGTPSSQTDALKPPNEVDPWVMLGGTELHQHEMGHPHGFGINLIKWVGLTFPPAS